MEGYHSKEVYFPTGNESSYKNSVFIFQELLVKYMDPYGLLHANEKGFLVLHSSGQENNVTSYQGSL